MKNGFNQQYFFSQHKLMISTTAHSPHRKESYPRVYHDWRNKLYFSPTFACELLEGPGWQEDACCIIHFACGHVGNGRWPGESTLENPLWVEFLFPLNYYASINPRSRGYARIRWVHHSAYLYSNRHRGYRLLPARGQLGLINRWTARTG